MAVKIERVQLDGLSLDSFFTKDFLNKLQTEDIVPITIIAVKIAEIDGKKTPAFVQISHDSEDDKKKLIVRISSSNPDVADVEKIAQAIKKEG